MKKQRKNPSLPYLLVTGAVLIVVELHNTWHLSTPQEQRQLVATINQQQSTTSQVKHQAIRGVQQCGHQVSRLVGRLLGQ